MCHVIDIFWDLLEVRYNCAKFPHCRICVTDFREEDLLAPPIREQPRKCPSWIGLKMASFTCIYLVMIKAPIIISPSKIVMLNLTMYILTILRCSLKGICFSPTSALDSICWPSALGSSPPRPHKIFKCCF